MTYLAPVGLCLGFFFVFEFCDFALAVTVAAFLAGGAEAGGDASDESGFGGVAVLQVETEVPEVGVSDAVAELEDVTGEGGGGGWEGEEIGVEFMEGVGIRIWLSGVRGKVLSCRFEDRLFVLCGETVGGRLDFLTKAVAESGKRDQVFSCFLRNLEA